MVTRVGKDDAVSIEMPLAAGPAQRQERISWISCRAISPTSRSKEESEAAVHRAGAATRLLPEEAFSDNAAGTRTRSGCGVTIIFLLQEAQGTEQHLPSLQVGFTARGWKLSSLQQLFLCTPGGPDPDIQNLVNH